MKKIEIVPLWDNVLVKPDPQDSRMSDAGLYKPDTIDQPEKAHGTVIAVGPDVKKLKKGDRIIYGVYAGDPAGVEGEDYVFLEEKLALGLLAEKKSK